MGADWQPSLDDLIEAARGVSELPGYAADVEAALLELKERRAADAPVSVPPPTRPPTNQWTVSEDGIEPALLLCDGVVAAVFHQPWGLPVARRVAAALGGGHEVEALRTAEPTAEDVTNWLITERGYLWNDHELGAVQDVLEARAALVREQTEETCRECGNTITEFDRCSEGSGFCVGCCPQCTANHEGSDRAE